MSTATKFGKFIATLTLHKVKIACVVAACVIGTCITVVSVTALAGNTDKPTETDHPPVGQPLPTGLGDTNRFMWQSPIQNGSRMEISGSYLTNLFIIQCENAIVEWTICTPDVIELSFFPFTIHAIGPGETTLTLYLRLRGEVVTRTVTIAVSCYNNS